MNHYGARYIFAVSPSIVSVLESKMPITQQQGFDMAAVENHEFNQYLDCCAEMEYLFCNTKYWRTGASFFKSNKKKHNTLNTE